MADVDDMPGLDRRALLKGAAAAAVTLAAGCSNDSKARVAPTSSPSATGSVSGPVIRRRAANIAHGDRSRPEIALTFHASGDPQLAIELLNLLARRRTHVTVFIVGEWLAANPHLTARMLAGGHELGNHTWSHPALSRLPRAQVRSEIERCKAELIRQTGKPGVAFRPSATAHPSSLILEEAYAAGYRTSVGEDVDPVDYLALSPDAIAKRVARNLMPGSIVSLHFGYQDTIDAMTPLLDRIHAMKLTPVRVSELLAHTPGAVPTP